MQIPQMKTKQRRKVCQVKRKTEKMRKMKIRKTACLRAMIKKEPEGSDSAQGADEQTIGSANGQDGVYIVEKGDTLAIISVRYTANLTM